MGCITLLAFWLANLNGLTPHKIPQKLFGIELSPPAGALLTEVEKLYGKSVLEEVRADWEASHYGESAVAADGTPIVRINGLTGRTEATIVHELFHLKLRAEGFAVLEFELPHGSNNEENRDYLQWLGYHLRDPIQHWIFYPTMRRVGLIPDSELRNEFEQALSEGDYRGLKPATEQKARALYYFKAALQLDDTHLLSRIRDWYYKRGWSRALRLGEKLTQMVLEANPRTPRQEIDTFLRCANFLLPDTARFSLQDWLTRPTGGHIENVALIRIEPPSR